MPAGVRGFILFHIRRIFHFIIFNDCKSVFIEYFDEHDYATVAFLLKQNYCKNLKTVI